MKIYYRIISKDENEQNIVVRYWTDSISEDTLAVDYLTGSIERDNYGHPKHCRTDYNFTLYDSELWKNESKLNEFIINNAPVSWFELKEKVSNNSVNTSITAVKLGKTSSANVTPIVLSSIPPLISDRQFFQQLAIIGIITEEEALNANRAIIPAALLALIEQLPEEQQFDAKMKVSGATQFLRSDPLTNAIGTAFGFTSEQIDQFFIDAAKLI